MKLLAKTRLSWISGTKGRYAYRAVSFGFCLLIIETMLSRDAAFVVSETFLFGRRKETSVFPESIVEDRPGISAYVYSHADREDHQVSMLRFSHSVFHFYRLSIGRSIGRIDPIYRSIIGLTLSIGTSCLNLARIDKSQIPRLLDEYRFRLYRDSIERKIQLGAKRFPRKRCNGSEG